MEKTVVTDFVIADHEHVITENSLANGGECPSCNMNDYKSWCVLRNTYKTEYCVGQKCRTRTLYRCSCNSSHEYWIYKN